MPYSLQAVKKGRRGPVDTDLTLDPDNDPQGQEEEEEETLTTDAMVKVNYRTPTLGSLCNLPTLLMFFFFFVVVDYFSIRACPIVSYSMRSRTEAYTSYKPLHSKQAIRGPAWRVCIVVVVLLSVYLLFCHWFCSINFSLSQPFSKRRPRLQKPSSRRKPGIRERAKEKGKEKERARSKIMPSLRRDLHIVKKEKEKQQQKHTCSFLLSVKNTDGRRQRLDFPEVIERSVLTSREKVKRGSVFSN